jgi:hypothetical protein
VGAKSPDVRSPTRLGATTAGSTATISVTRDFLASCVCPAGISAVDAPASSSSLSRRLPAMSSDAKMNEYAYWGVY